MNRGRSTSRTVTIAAAASACVLVAVVAPASGQAAPAAKAARPTVTLRAATDTVVAEKFGKRISADLGTYLVAGDVPFEVRTTRDPSYRTPVVGHLVVGEPDSEGGTADDVLLGPSMVVDFGGLQDFLHLRVRDADGHLVVDRTKDLCVGSQGVRTSPDAPDTSPYPSSFGCRFHPFTLGSVMGIQAGWGAPAFGEYGTRFRLPLGRYEVAMSVDPRYRDLLGLTSDTATETVRMRVVKGDGDCRGCRSGSATGAGRGSVAGPEAQPAAHEPRADIAPPTGTPLPDLRSLPSTGIRVQKGHFLAFGATVWNGGPSNLVIDGFRRAGEDVMDSYQYFYDQAGDPAGHAQVGTMVWDPRDGHHHWHFRDFARYRLLDSDKQAIVRSKKEAFCLAATDAVDYTVPGANWEPWNTDLHTACGGHGSLAVREVLDVGSGDTYTQYRPGQSFNLDGLPDGIYFISVEANPKHNLYEADLTNNNSLRKVRIGTDRSGDRTVKVFDVGLIHTH